MLKPLHLSRTELATYVARQLTIFYPDGLDTDAPTVLAAHMDAALARRPEVLLLDELAHSNVSGSRHPKRWQDVQELLDAGINVWTTLNVQHLESLNDVVSGIVGIQVHETVPDHIFDDADEVIVVDIPPEELLKRLKSGKVYPLEQAERASRNFFRQGNLLALRELALRRTADRVDEDMRDYRRERSIGDVWPTRERLLVGVGGRAGDDALVRQVARLARRLEADWVVVYVDAPERQHRPRAAQEAVLKTLALLMGVGITGWAVRGGTLEYCVLDHCPLKKQDFSGISLRGTSFAEADLEKADLSGCDLTETVFRNAQLKECDLRRAKFSRTDIRFAKMQKTKIDLEGAVYLAGLLGAVVN